MSAAPALVATVICADQLAADEPAAILAIKGGSDPAYYCPSCFWRQDNGMYFWAAEDGQPPACPHCGDDLHAMTYCSLHDRADCRAC
ncbi:hypothetical protein [Nonomuraea basaltis]|uniref:hypothetical protein n=1 Tax=Nonomuraea basaltis TaxID=2495887 RepID=UPI00110C4059|nr:hypothetical protein [Nonomuraea basaltis]TMR89498.1 hypothetical protein EJK15_60480 [Nonomuraea basaltis]